MQPTPACLVRARLFVLALILIHGSSLHLGAAAPPANDTCANAIVIPAAGPFPYRTPLVADIRSATTNGETVLPSCAFDVTRSIWYRFTPSATARYTLSTAFDTATTLENPVMSIFTSPGGCSGPFSELACNDDTGGFNQRAGISTSLTNGVSYYIVVWTGTLPDLEDTNSNYAVQLLVTKPVVPPNDSCATASPIPPSGPFPYWTATNDTTLATTSNGLNPSCVTDPDQTPSREVWYTFQPATAGSYIFSAKLDETGTTIPDTAITIYTGTCAGLTPIAGGCNDNGIASAKFAVNLTNNLLYYIAVWDNSPDPIVGETVVNLTVTQPKKPSVLTLGATSISSTGVVLNGSVNNNGGTLNPRFWFEWGLSTSLGSTSKVTLLLPSTTTEITTNVAISGHLPNTTYFYEMVATNNMGMTRGGLRTFRFFNDRPVVQNPDFKTDSRFVLDFTGHSNHVYYIDGSSNLAQWVQLGLATASADGTNFHFISQPNGSAPHRFYRARIP